MLTTSEGEFDTKNVTRNIVFKVKIYFKKILFLFTFARNLTFLLRNRGRNVLISHILGFLNVTKTMH